MRCFPAFDGVGIGLRQYTAAPTIAGSVVTGGTIAEFSLIPRVQSGLFSFLVMK
jgi:hypothetical protein